MTKEEERKKRIKKLRDKFEYKSDQLVKNEGWHGKDRLARIKENKAIQDAVKAYDRKGSKKREQGSKYEAQSAAGTAKSAADRERHMKLVLGDDWKPSDEGRLNRDRILAKMDKRNRALDPKNDPGFLSALRNKMDINPTDAEVERRLMARSNARREQERLSEGEAGGAKVGSAAERIREARKVREATQRDEDFQRKRHEDYQKFRSGKGALEVAREPTTGGLEDLGTESLRERVNKDARVKDYKDFSDEASLNAQERARRGEGGLIQQGMTGGSLEDLAGEGSAALTEMEEREQRKYGGVGKEMLEERHQREKGLMNIGSLPPSERAKLEDPEAAGTRIAPDDPYMKEIAGDPDAPGLKEFGASVMQESIEGDMEAGMKQDEVERAVNEEFTGEMNQEEAQQAIKDASPEDQKEISKVIAEEKGMGSDEWVESKEATGNYVRYEGSGLVINMAALGKDIQRNRNMEMLKHIPAANRAAMLVEWGYIDPGDLSIAQKQSAKELKELSLLDLRIAETQGKIEKNKNSMGDKDKIRYTAATKSMQDALKNGQYDLAEVYRNELNSIMPTGDTSNFQELIDKGIKKSKIKTPMKVFQAGGLKDGTKYYASALSIAEKVNFLRNPNNKSSQASKFDQLIGQTAIDPVTGANKGTYGDFLKNQGIYSWKDVTGPTFKKADFLKKNPKAAWALDSEESYMKWALPQVQNKLMTGIWGTVHQQIQQLNGKQVEVVRKKLSKDVMNPQTGERWSESTDYDQIAKDEKAKKASLKAKKEKQKEERKIEENPSKISSGEKARTASKNNKTYQYENFTKRASKSRKYLENNRASLSDKEIQKMETKIENYEKRAQEFLEASQSIEKEEKIKKDKHKLLEGLKEYNKERQAQGLPWVKADEYIRLKKEGKIK